MQKLVWQNANGVELDLTSGNYGITEWEGFSNTSLNIQSQQVPFQDGGVFLDALIEQRELSVTLAMQDRNNLEERYRQRRELISALNPKLGEGYLIYTNDYISKRIKCVPQIPLFETHNSDTVGTPKASLSWTACEPYWEDLEETEILIEYDKKPIIENTGDVDVQVDVKFIPQVSITNPEIKNINTNKIIKYDGIVNYPEQLRINTNVGKKEVLKEGSEIDIIDYNYKFRKVIYSESIGLYVGLVFSNSMTIILTSNNGKNWEKSSILNIVCYDIVNITELNKIFIIGQKGIIYSSSDGKIWTSLNSGVSSNDINAICYSEDLNLLVASYGNYGIIVSSDNGQSWTQYSSATTKKVTSICYSRTLQLFCGVSNSINGYIATSIDGITWTPQTNGINTILNKIIYSEEKGIFITIGNQNTIATSIDGITWTPQTISSYNDMQFKDILFSKTFNIFIIIGFNNNQRNYIGVSEDGTNWSDKTNTGIQTINLICLNESITFGISIYGILENGMGETYIARRIIIKSNDGENYIVQDNNIIYPLEKIKFINNMFFVLGNNGYLSKSLYGQEWTASQILRWKELLDITYSSKLNLYIIGANGALLYSNNTDSWNAQVFQGRFVKLIWSEEKEIFIACFRNTSNSLYEVLTSYNGIDWTKRFECSSNQITMNTIIYSVEKEVFIIGTNHSKVIISSNGIDWTENDITSNVSQIMDIIYSDKLHQFIAIGKQDISGIICTSTDGINWNIRYSESLLVLSEIHYIQENNTFIVISGKKTLKSSDAVTWTEEGNIFATSLTQGFGKIIWLVDNNIATYIVDTQENVIQNISQDSDMSFQLEIGENQIVLNSQIGKFNAILKYHQKYIGV